MSLFKQPRSPFWYTEIVVNGRRVRRSTRHKSRREAEVFERELREQIKREDEATRGKPTAVLTLDHACGRYWLEHGQHLADAVNVERWIRYIIRYMDASRPLADLSTRHVTAFVTDMRTDGIGEISINRTISTLQGIHNRAAKRWEAPVKVIDWRPHKSRERGRTRWITQDQARKFLEALPPDTAEIVYFILLTGARRAEAFGLLRENIDWQNGTATAIAKGGKQHVFELTAEGLLHLRSIPDRGRYAFDTTGYRKRFDMAKVAAEIEDFTWHDLRHTFATWLGQAGGSLEVIKEQLGHSSIAVTQKYRHVARREVRAAMSKMKPLTDVADNVVPLKKKDEG